MKIAIYHRPGSFSDRWMEYCKEKGIEYKIVNAYDSNIVEQVKDCDAFMWLHHHSNIKDTLFANITDFRVKVVDGNCWVFQRCVRKGGFRASGSDELLFDNLKIPIELVKTAQYTASKIGTQSAAFDFIYNKEKKSFVIVELSYGFGFDADEIHNG